MNPLNMYVTTCRMVLQSSADDASTWADISRLLSCLRQSLTCSVCSKILTSPMTSSVSNCNHNICKDCVGGKMCLKLACDRCNDHTKFEENGPMKVLVQCYKKLCEYITNSALHRRWGNLNGGTNTNLADIVQEGAGLTTEHHTPSASNQTMSIASLRSAIINFCPRAGLKLQPDQHGSLSVDYGSKVTNGNGSVFGTSTGRTAPSVVGGDGSESDGSNLEYSGESIPKPHNSRDAGASLEIARCFRPKRKNCRCGVATPNPGKLTCCGQRCPCYVEQRACAQCRCRGCRNPNKVSYKNMHYEGIQLEIQEMAEVDCYVENMVDANGDINT